MNEMKKTGIFVGVAVILVLIALVTSPRRITPEAFSEQGQEFFADFTDPNVAQTLEVIDFDPTSGAAHPFKVTFKNNHWTIPSHNDYPADAKDRLAKTAAGVIGIKKEELRSTSVADHEACGVIDPMDETVVGLEGRGKRITLRDADDRVLADFIVGKDVPGRSGLKFVRLPGQNQVYTARMNLDISTRFADWIETNLLDLTKSQVNKLVLNDYRINEQSRSVEQRDNIVLSLKDDGSWGMNKTGKPVDSAKVAQLLTALEGVRINGVRPKPEGLSASLTKGGQISQTDAMSLQSKGFYFSRDGRLVSNEGELQIHTMDGVLYTLRFGEVFYGSGMALSAGAGDAGEVDDGSENRYLFVTAEFDPKQFPKPSAPANTDFLNKADSLWNDDDRANKKKQDALDRWQSQVAAGEARADTLSQRFAGWYYLISSESFDKVKLNRSDLIAKTES